MSFGLRAVISFLQCPRNQRPSVTATLRLGLREAASILDGSPLPSPHDLLEAAGDRKLLCRFVDRYLARHNFVSVRATTSRRSR